MSSKRRKIARTRQVQQNQDTKPKMQGALPLALLARDGYINQLAYLGEASPMTEANDYQRNSISRDYELLTVLYRENWIAKRIIDTPCEDMTRSWYTISSALDQEKLDEIAELESKHSVKQEITNALRWARLYGGAAAVVVIKGHEDMLDQPLDYDDLMPGCFRGLIVVDRMSGLDPSVELEEDMDDLEFGYPKYYTVRLNNESGDVVKVHHSRLLMFRGRMLPITEEINESYWGASEFEHIYEELQKRNSTSANIAQLVFQANVGVLKMADFGEVMGMGTEKQKQAIIDSIHEENRFRTSFGMMIMGSQDGYEQHPYSFSGLSEIYEAFMMDMAGAAEIPATKLYGRSPQGMNATGESDLKNYYEMLSQLQERNLRPAIEKLLPILCMSLWGKIPNDIKVVFEPLQVTTPGERAQIVSQVTGTVIQAFTAGLISQQTALMELQRTGKDVGSWGSITDEVIDKAEAEVDQGEGMGDPMAGMMGGMGPAGSEGPEGPEDSGSPGGGMDPMAAMGGMMPPETAPDEKKPEEQAEEKPEDAVEEPPEEAPEAEKKKGDDPIAAVIEEAQEGKEKPPESGQDGELGSTGSKPPVEKMNREREQQSNLVAHRKTKENAEQQKHMNKMKEQVMAAAAKGDLDGARKIVREYRNYFPSDPSSAEKVQSETLKRQRAAKPSRWIHDAFTRLFGRRKKEDQRTKQIRDYAANHSRNETAEFILNLYSVDAEAWRTTEEGRHFKLETSTGEIKAGFGGKFNGKKIGEQWEANSGSKPRKTGSKVAPPPKAEPKSGAKPKVSVSFNETSVGTVKNKAFADETAARYNESLSEVKSVFSNPTATREQKEEAMSYLISTATNSDQWYHAQRGDAPAIQDFGLGKVPREWAERLTPVEQEVLAKISEETDGMNYIESESWRKKNESAESVQMKLQAKLLGAEIDVEIPADVLKKYAGIEERQEVPGQQSMFWGENVPSNADGTP